MDQANIIGLKELRQNMSAFAEKIQKGQTFIVVKQSKPLFKISPLGFEDTEVWEEVANFTKIKKGGVKLEELLSRI